MFHRPTTACLVFVTLAAALALAAPVSYAVSPPPSILFLLPDRGDVAGGDIVAILGSDFQDGATVKFGILPGFVSFINPNLLTAVTPPGLPGPVDVEVRNPDGQSTVLPDGYTYQIGGGSPEILALFPDSGTVDGGDTVGVFGAGFQEGATVTFGGVPSPSVTFLTSGILQVVTPPGPAGVVDVEVCNPGNDCGSLANAFSYEEPVDLPECFAGAITPQTDVLLVNASAGGMDRRVIVHESGPLFASLSLPPGGGSGEFVIHANLAEPSVESQVVLPLQIGTFCFELLLGHGATPAAVWNNIGKESRVGASMYFDGTPIADPAPAPVVFLSLPDGDALHLPVGTVFTLQGVMRDPASPSPKGAATTNAVVVEVL